MGTVSSYFDIRIHREWEVGIGHNHLFEAPYMCVVGDKILLLLSNLSNHVCCEWRVFPNIS